MAKKREQAKPAPSGKTAAEMTDEELDEFLMRQGYVPRGGSSSEIEKWETGRVVEGIYCGQREGQFGSLIDLRPRDGHMLTFGCPKILQSRIEGVAVGAALIIKCVGKIETSKGPAWNFKVYSQDQLPLPF